jgi:large subunit ribosomal protein L25
MTETHELRIEKRAGVGKGAARAARRAGLVPAIIYGGDGEPEPAAVSLRELNKLLEQGGFMNALVDLVGDGGTTKVLPRDIQFDVVTDWPLHIDFLRVSERTVLHIEVPVLFLNEDTCPGLRRGGVLNIVRHAVEVVCRADAIPEHIEVDLANAEIGDSLHISAVALPEGVRPAITDRDFTIATVAAPNVRETTDEEEAAEAAAPAATEEAGESDED